MRLTRLEAKGFKSFGDKVVLHFGQGVTGVVGPNGCGKSNIVDAMRWVLGEQKMRNLRSEKMENIIFNGTATRKPQQLAEVSLSFDNDRGVLPVKYTQVTVSRRLYRSGESEYAINGVNCRLKDIDMLFADTGIGPDSYAIIELGAVDNILNDRDNSRRTLFEEAAGITRFKTRRKETLRRLEDVKTDLDRVDDLLHEIMRNLRSLERQARQAERYFELKEKHRSVGVAAGRREYLRREQEAGRIRQDSDKLRLEREAIGEQIEKADRFALELKGDVGASEQLLHGRQRTYGQLQDKIRQIENERKVSSERRRSAMQRKDQLGQQQAADGARLQTVSSAVARLGEEEVALTDALNAVVGGLTLRQADTEAAQVATQQVIQEQDQGERALRETSERLRQLQQSYEVGKAQLATYGQEQERLKERTAKETSDFGEFDTKLKVLDRQGEEQRLALAHSQRLEEERQAAEQAAQVRGEELREEITTHTRRRDGLQNEYNLTKSLQDNLEGYPEAIRYLRKTKGWAQAESVPLVSDLFACPEQYRVALEYYLEPVMNHYVVETEAEALRAVEMLSGAGKGKASFFVLSRFIGLHERVIETLPAGALPVMNVIECEEQYRPLVRFLLGQAVLVDGPIYEAGDLDLLATQGNLVRRKQVVQGGSIGLYEGKRIGRVKNLEKLQAELMILNKRIKEQEEERTKIQAALLALRGQDHRKQLDTLRRELARVEQEGALWRVRKEQAQQTLADQARRLDTLAETVARIVQEAADQAPELATLQTQRTELLAGQQSQREARTQAEAALREAREGLNRIQLEQVKLNGLLTQARREGQIRQEDKERLMERLARNEGELAATEAALADLDKTENVGDEDLQEFYIELKAIDLGVKEANKALFDARGRVEESERLTRELTRRREQNQVLLGEMATQLAGHEARLEALAERLRAEFNLSVQDAVEPEELSGMAEAELIKEATQLRDQLEKLGPINPVAMESYQEMKERHDFISAQKNDLVEARTSLEETIGEIEGEARKAFYETYEAVRANFHKVFRSLFTEEDTCDLILANPANPLESAIDIIARPKGKRPLSINQLSGGEKTLTATALLFAIYLVKPAPFCIFDEVDAPLDDANIDKFNNIIRDFSDRSQFVIVTHNKRTMTHADVLYGITMVEQGVSRVIPVDLRELETA